MTESTLNGALRVTIERAPLAAALALLVRGVTRRNTIPILSNVAISADATGNGMLRFLVTNLDQQILIDVPAYVDAPGALTCDAATLADIVKKCPAGARVELMHHVDSGKVSIVAGRARSAIGVMPRDDFPAVADVAPAWAFQYDRDALALDLARLAPCISSEETRYYLNGVAWRARRGGLALVASDGVQAAVIDRAGFPDAAGLGDAGTISGGAILPRAAVDLLQRAVKLADSGAVACAFDSARAQFTVAAGGSFVTVTSKLIDGDYPDVMGAVDSAIGDGLARVMFPEIDDRINAGMLAKLAKPCAGAVAVDMGAGGAILTCEAAPEYLGFMMAVRDGANKIGKFAYRSDESKVAAYLRQLARDAGLAPDATDTKDGNGHTIQHCRLAKSGGLFTGATFGKYEYVPATEIEWPNYESMTVEIVKVEARHEYAEGSFSIAMPAAAALVHCDVTADYGDGERAIRTDSAGAIQWDAATVARLVGDLSECPIQRVKIAPLHQYRGAALPAGWIMPAAVKVKKAARDDAAALAAYCAGNVEAAPVPIWTGAGSRAWSTDDLQYVADSYGYIWRDVGAMIADYADDESSDDAAVMAVAAMSPAARVEAAREAVELSVPVTIEALQASVSVESDEPAQSATEAGIDAEALAVAEMAALPDATPDATPFVVPDALRTSQFDKPAADVAPDLAALVASLVARIEALESERAAPADDVAVPVAVDNAAVLAAEARADDLAAQLAAMTRDRDDWQAIAEQNSARLDSEREAVKADLAAMAGYEKRADSLYRKRDRTAAAIRKVRGRADLDKRALAATVEHVAQWRDDLDNARVALAAVTARAERAESELKRRAVLDPLAGLRYAGGAARASKGGAA